MQKLKRLTAWLQKNIWCFIVGALVTIFWMAAFWYAGQGPAIATWLSILFTWLVVVYMLIQGDQLRDLIERGHKLMEAKTDQLSKRFLDFANLWLPEGHRLATGRADRARVADEPNFQINTAACNWVTLLTFYIIVKAYQSEQLIHVDKMAKILYREQYRLFIPDTMLAATGATVLGIIMGLTGFLDVGSIELKAERVKINLLPPELVQHMPTALENRIKEPSMGKVDRNRLQSFKDEIDKYFTAA